MPSRLAPAALAAILTLAPTGVSRAAGMIPEGSIFELVAAVAGEAVIATTSMLTAEEEFAGAFAAAALGLGGGEIRLTFEGDPDPSLDYVLEVENLSGQAQNVTFSLLMPMVALSALDQVSASLEVALTDVDGSGSAFLAPLNANVQQATVSEDGFTATSLGVDVGVGTFDPGGAFSAGPIAGPAPNPAIGPAWVALAVTGGFSLSAGDAATLTGNVTLVPEPSLALLGAAVLTAIRRGHR
jgi:hypothetical protein